MNKKKARSRLIISESENDADMLYATGFRAPDAFVYLESRGCRAILLDDLEYDRGKREARVDEVVSASDIRNRLMKKSGINPSFIEVAACFLKSRGGTRPLVPSKFPLGIARQLLDHDIVVEPVLGAFYPERQFKTDEEIRFIKRATRITEQGMERAFEILRASILSNKKNKKNLLHWGGGILTSERLRIEIESTILRAGGIPCANSIVACAQQACDPHERGHGPLKGNELIILDLFPRDATSGYYGDITRTVIRGKATEAQMHLWKICLLGQKIAIDAICPGIYGGVIHRMVTQFFDDSGYPLQRVAANRHASKGRLSGFFHGTGHGIGRDLHEEPRFGVATLQIGQVFTIEPGLYIPGIGGVRHEDLILITPKGCKMISKIAKPCEI